MAQAMRDESLSCSVCLETLKEPVTVPCGHSYCRECIETVWSSEDSHSCPQCRQSFSPRPDLSTNTTLANLLDKLSGSNTVHDQVHNARIVSCDLCPGIKLNAVKTCLQCLKSLCQSHLQPHIDDVMLQRHQLVEPTDKLMDHHCKDHNELKTLFCLTEQELLCHLCVDKHKGHETVSSEAERAERQKHVDDKKTRLLQNLRDKETEKGELTKEADDIKNFAQAALDQNRKVFRDMAVLLENKRAAMELQIQTEEQNKLKHVQDLQNQLREDISALKKDIGELDTLSLTTDHSQFILHCPPLSTLTMDTKIGTQNPNPNPNPNLNATRTTPRKHFEDLIRPLAAIKFRLGVILTESRFVTGLNQLKRRHANTTDVPLYSPNFASLLLPEPTSGSRTDFLRYACEIKLKPSTANRLLTLSDEDRKASLGIISGPDHPHRFIDCYQVLSTDGMTGRRYWEVKLSGKYFVDVAVSYRDIERGNRPDCQSVFGHNDKSWAVCCDKNGYAFRFDRQTTKVSAPVSSTIGVFLNHRAGILSFYSVRDDTVRLIHRVRTKFTQPLYAGVGFAVVGDTAHFHQLK